MNLPEQADFDSRMSIVGRFNVVTDQVYDDGTIINHWASWTGPLDGQVYSVTCDQTVGSEFSTVSNYNGDLGLNDDSAFVANLAHNEIGLQILRSTYTGGQDFAAADTAATNEKARRLQRILAETAGSTDSANTQEKVDFDVDRFCTEYP